MTILDFTTTNKVVCYNRDYTVNAPVSDSSYLSTVDYRSDAFSLAQHTYNGIYYGIWYGNISTATIDQFMLTYSSPNFTDGSQVIGFRIRPSGGFVIFEILEGTFDASGQPNPTQLYSTTGTVPLPTSTCQIAWYMNRIVGQENTTAIWFNKWNLNLNSLPVGPVTSVVMPAQIIMSSGTPNGYKMGMLWTGFNNSITKTKFQNILDYWTSPAPYFLGRHGELPLLGIPSNSYINCSQSVVNDMAIEGYYSATGTVSYAQTNSITFVQPFSSFDGFDR